MKNLKTTKTTTTKEVEPYWFIDYVTYHFVDDDLKDYRIEKELYSENRSFYYLMKGNQILISGNSSVHYPYLISTLKDAKRRILFDIEPWHDGTNSQRWVEQSEDLVYPLYLNHLHQNRLK
tara:strand:+ start:398 stop:760 length:363 start_codon:yes stop_codon:yes gene_type:complete